MNDLQIFSNPEFGQVRTVELGSRIDQLRIVAFGLPAFDQIMADIFTTEKRSDHYEEAYSSRPFYPIHECP